MTLVLEQLARANLVWVHDVFVRVGEIKDPGETQFFKLIVATRNPAIKASRIDETVLNIVVDRADDSVLSAIKEALLENQSLREAHEKIRNGVWYRSTMTITQS